MLVRAAVRRPVTTFTVTVILVLLGITAAMKLELAFLPKVEFPTIMVMVPYYGASPQEVEELVVKPLEERLMTLSGLKEIESESMENFGIITLNFKWGTDIDLAYMEVAEKIDLARSDLPRRARPLIFKFSPEIMPALILSVSGNVEMERLSDVAEDLKKKIERLPSISYVQALGERPREVQIIADYKKLLSKGIGVSMLQTAILGANIRQSGGEIVKGEKYYPVSLDAKLKTLEQIGNIRLSKGAGFGPMAGAMAGMDISALLGRRARTKIKDVAEIRIGSRLIGPKAFLNGVPNILLTVHRKSGVNILTAAEEVKNFLKTYKPPANVKVEIASDQSRIINRALSTLKRNLLIGASVAVLILLLFLRDFRVILLVGLAIPLSILVALLFMYFFGMTINIMSLGGMALAVGMLVDNAIVVTENIYRHTEAGEKPKRASILGASEVGAAITASTLTTISMFLPVIFMKGFAQRMFSDLAIAVTLALLASLLVALTFVPASSQFVIRGAEPRLKALRESYKKALRWVLKRKALVVTAVLVGFVASVALLVKLGFVLMPSTSIPEFGISFSLPPGTNVSKTARVADEIASYLLSRKDDFRIKYVYVAYGEGGEGFMQGFMDIGKEKGLVGCRLDDTEGLFPVPKIREALEKDLFPDLKSRYPGLDIDFIDLAEEIVGSSGKSIEIEVIGNDDQTLEKLSNEIAKRIKKFKFAKDVSSSISEKMEKIVIKPDLEKMESKKLSLLQVSAELEAISGRQSAGSILLGNEILDISIYATNVPKMDIRNIRIPNIYGGKVRLGDIATVERKLVPLKVIHRDGRKMAIVDMDVVGVPLDQAKRKVEKAISGIRLPRGCAIKIAGEVEELEETVRQFIFALGFGLLLMYMVMVAEFESFIYPFAIIFTVPMGLIGVAIFFWVARMSISAVALVGILTLTGIVVNNGIVMIDYINQLRERGMSKYEAIVEGASARLRPILMTSLTTIIALLPELVLKGQGREIHLPMALAVIGGLSVATVMTLFFEPVFYAILDRLSMRFREGEK